MKGPCMWNVMLLIISIVYISCIYCCIIRYIPKNFDIPSRISSFKFTFGDDDRTSTFEIIITLLKVRLKNWTPKMKN